MTPTRLIQTGDATNIAEVTRNMEQQPGKGRVEKGYDPSQSKSCLHVNFTVVILNDHISTYTNIQWSDWKDKNRKQMKSQGDHWSKATLQGTSIWHCLENNKIDRRHVVQWKPEQDAIYQVSLTRK